MLIARRFHVRFSQPQLSWILRQMGFSVQYRPELLDSRRLHRRDRPHLDTAMTSPRSETLRSTTAGRLRLDPATGAQRVLLHLKPGLGSYQSRGRTPRRRRPAVPIGGTRRPPGSRTRRDGQRSPGRALPPQRAHIRVLQAI
ncbi:hypothetical protein [Streptomyces avermitilis]|uniref:hypothetical protein n=1 Tax=Streptomyces avermitilis TaxID=33903 RepID=UPI003F4CE8DF